MYPDGVWMVKQWIKSGVVYALSYLTVKCNVKFCGFYGLFKLYLWVLIVPELEMTG